MPKSIDFGHAGMWLHWAIAALLVVIAVAWLAVSQASVVRPTSERKPIGMAAKPIRQAASVEAATLYDPRDIKPLSAPVAMAVNAATPAAGPVGVGAAAFAIDKSRPDLRETALQCLTTALYYEAASESDDGQRAVAQVILNRMRHPAYPASVCGVVYQGSTRTTGCQFSFTCDGSLARKPSTSGWSRSRTLAQAALSGRVYAPVGHATHYHADYVVPYWAPTLDKLVQVGRHIFYRWMGGAGRAGAFAQRYARAEMIPAPVATENPALPQTDEMLAVVSSEMLETGQVAAVAQLVPTEVRAIAMPPEKMIEEDRRAAPRLLADAEAGSLRQPLGRAGKNVATARVDEGSLVCDQGKQAAPIQPNRAAAANLSNARAGCS